MNTHGEMEHAGRVRRGRAVAYALYKARRSPPEDRAEWLELAQVLTGLDPLAFTELPTVAAERGTGREWVLLRYTITHPTGHRADRLPRDQAHDELAAYGMSAQEIERALEDAAPS